MYFPDLSPYQYNVPRPLGNVLNIGWLDAGHPFESASNQANLVEAITQWFPAARVNPLRGFHICPFCGVRSRSEIIVNGRITPLGGTELWIRARGGTIYAAPDMIAHYVGSHHYLPPQVFIDAVSDVSLKESWDAPKEFERLTLEAFK